MSRPWLLALLLAVGLFAAFLGRKTTRNINPNLVIYSQDSNRNPLILPCPGDSTETTATFESVVRVQKRLMDKAHAPQEMALEAVQRQLQFLVGYLKHDPQLSAMGRFIPAAAAPQIQILSKHVTTYNQDITVDSIEDGRATEYQKLAVATKELRAADPAYEIRYQAKKKLLICMNSGKTPSSIEVALPFDPYVSYWSVPKDQRRHLFFNGKKTLVNPCAHPEMAELKFPSFYWYVFNPRAKQKDFDKQDVLCEKILEPGRSYLLTRATIAEQPNNRKPIDLAQSFRDSKEPIRGTILVGPLQHWTVSMAKDIEYLQAHFGTQPKNLEEPIRAIWNELKTKKEPHDYAVGVLLETLKGLGQALSINDIQVKTENKSLVMQISGQLREGKRQIQITIFYGRTESDEPEPPQHYSYVWNSVRNEDFLFYLGHAGMGANFSFERLAKSLRLSGKDLKKGLQARPHFLVGLITCDAYTYFLDDLLRARHTEPAASNLSTDTILMASSFGRPLLPATLLKHIDRGIASGPNRLNTAFASATSPSDLFIVESYKGIDAELQAPIK